MPVTLVSDQTEGNNNSTPNPNTTTGAQADGIFQGNENGLPQITPFDSAAHALLKKRRIVVKYLNLQGRFQPVLFERPGLLLLLFSLACIQAARREGKMPPAPSPDGPMI